MAGFTCRYFYCCKVLPVYVLYTLYLVVCMQFFVPLSILFGHFSGYFPFPFRLHLKNNSIYIKLCHFVCRTTICQVFILIKHGLHLHVCWVIIFTWKVEKGIQCTCMDIIKIGIRLTKFSFCNWKHVRRILKGDDVVPVIDCAFLGLKFDRGWSNN